MDITLGKVSVHYDASWARVVSDLLSPPVVWAALAIPIALRDAPSQGQGMLWAGVYILLVCLLPVMYIAYLVKRGAVTDIHLKLRHQRTRPFLISIFCAMLALVTLMLLNPPQIVPMFALFTVIQLCLIAAITLTWQISVHAMSISGAAVAAGVLFGLMSLVALLPLVILVGAARLNLKRHTPAQVVAGAVIGVATPLLLFVVIATP